MKPTWKYYVPGNYEKKGHSYHWFKCFKVYWAYRWWIAETIDKKGVLDGTDKTCTKIVFTTYAERYK